MTVSVVIPCYNAGPYLVQAIGSALDQTRPPHEVIVVDDGSTDGSLSVARQVEARVPGQVRVVSQRSGRASRTRNVGARLATGDALMFLDADDVIAPDTLEALTAALAAETAGVAICPWFRLALHDGRWIERPPSCKPRLVGEDALSAWLTGWYHPPCSVLWSRAAFERAGRWGGGNNPNDDGDLMMRALANDIPLLQTRAGAGYYRRRADGEASLSGTRFSRDGLAARIRTVRTIAVLLEDRSQLDAYRPALFTAFRLIAADARDQADLAAQARGLSRRYGLSRWARMGRRMRRAPARSSPAGAVEPALEVRYGLSFAEHLLRSAPPALVSGAGAHVSGFDLPAVSVVIPTHNRAHLLRRAIDSVLAQTFRDYEVLVVDDGSTDDTPRVATACGDSRVRYVPQPRRTGVGAARNRGLRESRGELIAFLDSDDEWLPEKLDRQVALLRQRPPDVGLVYTGVASVASDGTTRVKCSRARGDVYRQMLVSNIIHGGGSNVLMRREVVATAGFFREDLPAAEDYDYWLRITRFFEVDVVDEPLIRYYDPPEVERRSTAVQANLDARWRLYRQYGPEMRRAGVAHLFLLRSVRWALGCPRPDRRAARRFAARAVREAPLSRMAVATWIATMTGPASRVPWVQRHAVLE